MKRAWIFNWLKWAVMLAAFSYCSMARADIAIIRGQALYVIRCGRSGVPDLNAKEFLVCHLWKLYGEDGESVQWLPGGLILIVHEVNCPNGISRFGVPKGKTADGYWVVWPRPHAVLHRAPKLMQQEFVELGLYERPMVSPDGSYAVATYEQNSQDPDDSPRALFDTHTGKVLKKLQPDTELHWSSDGKLLFEYDVDNDPKFGPFTWILTIYDFPNMKIWKSFSPDWHISFAGLSPDGNLLAEHFYDPGDRPPDFILNIKTRQTESIPQPSQYAGTSFYFWTADGHSAICDWPVPNPTDDEESLRDYVGKVTFRNAKFVNFGLGTDVQPSLDHSHFFYVSEDERGNSTENLYLQTTSGKHRRLLIARHVLAFAVSNVGTEGAPWG